MIYIVILISFKTFSSINYETTKPFKAVLKSKAGERGGGGAKYLGPGLVEGARNLGKTSGHGCYCQEGWGP